MQLDTTSTDFVLGYVKLHITEASLSLTTITELSPIDVYSLIGNVGGIWGEQNETCSK